ncbi:MAG: acetate--CoA ligase family protein [Desulfomicrobium escambiense]|nr:acetate--CoA ligase family protein [Desulfomicrobium escambiense]
MPDSAQASFSAWVVSLLKFTTTQLFASRRLPMLTIQEMFADIRARKLLDEFRGMPEVKKDKLSQIIQAVGNVSLLHPEIAEIDLNPIIISGATPLVADALIVLQDKL